MAELLIDNIGAKGLNTDVMPSSLPPEFITNAGNIRVYSGKIRASGGYQDWAVPPVDYNMGYILPFPNSGAYRLIIAGRSAVYSFDGTNWTDISQAGGYPALGAGDELLWNGCIFGAIAVLNNTQSNPQYSVAGTQLLPLDFSPGVSWVAAQQSAKVIRGHKTFLFALNLTDNGIENKDAYRWSTSSDIDGLPYTWDVTDQSAIAGLAQLGGDSGAIIDGLSLKDAFIIYSERGINALTYTGGEFIWQRSELSNSAGLLSSNSIIEAAGAHFFLGDGDIFRNDGNSVNSILYGKVKNQFTKRITPEAYHTSFAIRNTAAEEIWFCVPFDGALSPNAAFIYNWHDGTFAIRDLPAGLMFGAYGQHTVGVDTWDTPAGDWNAGTDLWGGSYLSPMQETIIGIQGNAVLLLDPVDFTTSAYKASFIERVGFPLEGVKANATVLSVYPLMDGHLPVDITIGAQDLVGGPIRWEPAVTFTPNIDRKIDVRSTGELLCWRISSTTSATGSGDWEVSGMLVEYRVDGSR